jgi:hypothetical protein
VTTTIDRGETNLKNSRKSTGPRTPEGKARSRFNALKHGCRARSPILPGEDADAFRRRLDAWNGDLEPRDRVEQFLVHRAVQLSWQLERADRALAKGLDDARSAEVDRLAQLADEVAALGRRLFWDPRGPTCFYPQFETTIGKIPRVSWSGQIDDPDDPARLLNRLESTALGCAWLLDQWGELRDALERYHGWQPPDRFKAIRLLGRQPLDVWEDERVMAIYLACGAMDPAGPEAPSEFQDVANELHFGERERFVERLNARRAAAGRPAGPEAGEAVLLAIVSEEEVRLEELLAQHLEREVSSDSVLEFDASEAGERLRRYQATCDRALLRVLEALRKRQRDAERSGSAGRRSGGPAKEEAPDRSGRLVGLLNLLAAAKGAGVTNEANGPDDPFGRRSAEPAREVAAGPATAAEPETPIVTNEANGFADETRYATNEAAGPADEAPGATNEASQPINEARGATNEAAGTTAGLPPGPVRIGDLGSARWRGPETSPQHRSQETGKDSRPDPQEADESRVPHPREAVEPLDLPPTGLEPAAAQLPVASCQLPAVVIEPVADPDAPTATNEASGPAPSMTNEASGPAVSGGSTPVGPGSPEPALGPIEGLAAAEADGPAASRPMDAEPCDRAVIATNEAISLFEAEEKRCGIPPEGRAPSGSAPPGTRDAEAQTEPRRPEGIPDPFSVVRCSAVQRSVPDADGCGHGLLLRHPAPRDLGHAIDDGPEKKGQVGHGDGHGGDHPFREDLGNQPAPEHLIDDSGRREQQDDAQVSGRPPANPWPKPDEAASADEARDGQ